MNFADLKARSRKAVHSAFALPCQYTDPDGFHTTNLTARFHTKMAISGDIGSQGYSTIIEGVTRVVFNREELAAAGITLARRGRLVFPDYFAPGQAATLELDARDPHDGPIDEKWIVVLS